MPNMPRATGHLLTSLDMAVGKPAPYPHWLLHNVMPDEMLDRIIALPLSPPVIDDTLGRRETHNASRLFFGASQQANFSVCAGLAKVLQSEAYIDRLQSLTGASLRGSFLRIEYCLDINGFWLESHTDIGAKLFTMLIYLNDPPAGEEWGTDIYETPAKRLGPAPGGRNRGLIFVPGANTWHGFAKRPITGTRRSLIVNYVTPEWRTRHELAFPDKPVG